MQLLTPFTVFQANDSGSGNVDENNPPLTDNPEEYLREIEIKESEPMEVDAPLEPVVPLSVTCCCGEAVPESIYSCDICSRNMHNTCGVRVEGADKSTIRCGHCITMQSLFDTIDQSQQVKILLTSLGD